MKSAIVKRSIVLNGHKTSVSLENEFWICLHEVADRRKMKLSALLQQIDTDRRQTNLSSAIRVFVFNHLRALADDRQPSNPGPRVSMPPVAELAAVG